jgi:hypothetical protein
MVCSIMASTRRTAVLLLGLPGFLLLAAGCKLGSQPSGPTPHAQSENVPRLHRAEAPPPPVAEEILEHPAPLWEHGKPGKPVDAHVAGAQGYLVLDLGEGWVPYIFSDGTDPAGKPLPNSYRETYLQLARGEFPDNFQGERAKEDKYLELYGIMPNLQLLRTRFEQTANLACAREIDLTPLTSFEGLVVYETNEAAYKAVNDYTYLHGQVQKLMKAQHVDSAEALDVAALEDRDADRLKRFLKVAPEYRAVEATQKLLKCEGYFEGRGKYVRGALDWTTRDALAEFERRHRVYSWGYLGRDTLAVLRVPALEAERQGVLRVLLERAIHAAGVLEDGSTSTDANGQPVTFKGADGKDHPIPNLVAELEQRIVEGFGLQTPESTLAWLQSLGPLPAGEHRLVALRAPQLPEYYDGDMDLTLDYDRGDVWYDFPYDEQGRERAQPVERRPKVTIFTRYNGQKIPLARYGTTIGGWRSEQVGDSVMWAYKESPAGPRVWDEIVASPVWLPPDSTPPKDMLARVKDRKVGEPEFEVNYHETGPSYASAYGLVAAYHKKYFEKPDGTIVIGNDEGIRTHGSVDYMSIMRRHSHGCHRLLNHIAVRLMSFVLEHRPHTRLGNEHLGFRKEFTYQDVKYNVAIDEGGYVFKLDTPLKVEVGEGRIRGKQQTPVEVEIPKWNADVGAYVTADGGAVALRGNALVEVPMPVIDAGVAEPPNDISPVAVQTPALGVQLKPSVPRPPPMPASNKAPPTGR